MNPPSDNDRSFDDLFDETFSTLHEAIERMPGSSAAELAPVEIGTVTSVGRGVAEASGVPNVRSEELLQLPKRKLGLAFNLEPDRVDIILLDEADDLAVGDEVRRTRRVLDVPVGDGLMGRVIDPVGRPLDGHGIVHATGRRSGERSAPRIMDRLPVTVPLQTGIKVVDALIPIGRGQRELILGDRQTGKTAIALDTILHQHDQDVVCVYCAIGQRNTAVAKVVADLRSRGAMDYCVVVVGADDAPPGVQYIAPFAATTIGEYFMEQGRDVLVVYDDLTAHARAYRELSLLLRRPPGREAFPGDIFYLHSRLLERATHLKESLGGGSLTALPIAETEAQNVAAYIPTNLISITDGQIYLSPDLFQKGILPAVDVGRSVSRVGGKTQRAAYRAVAGDLRLSYTQFEELEAFSRFSSRLDETTRSRLERGRRVREVFKQPQFATLDVSEQIAVLIAVTAGLFDHVAIDDVAAAEKIVRTNVLQHHPDIAEQLEQGDALSDTMRDALLETARLALQSLTVAEADDAVA